MSSKIYFTLLCASVLGLTACGEKPEATVQQKNTATTQSDLPTYHVNVMNENPPYIQINEKGEITGLEADLLHAIAEKKGFQVTINSHPWNGLFETLNTGKSDMVCSGLFITPERAQKYNITRPYMEVKLGALVSADSNINTMTDLHNKTVMGRSGSNVFEKILKDEVLKGQSTETKGFDSTYLAVKALAQKQGDAVFAVETTLKDIQKKLPETFKTKFINYQQQNPIYVGCFTRLGRQDNLIDKFDTGLEELAKDGTLAKIMTKWTGQADSLPMVDKKIFVQ